GLSLGDVDPCLDEVRLPCSRLEERELGLRLREALLGDHDAEAPLVELVERDDALADLVGLLEAGELRLEVGERRLGLVDARLDGRDLLGARERLEASEARLRRLER